MTRIHPTAIVSDACELGEGVEIGPHCVLEGHVRLGDGVKLLGSCYVAGPIQIGAETRVYPFCCLGFDPQDRKFLPGTPTAGVIIGERCLIREHVTIHAATNDTRPTRVGDDAFLMNHSHIAHDAQVGARVVMVNGAGVAGHCIVEDDVNFGGNAVVHQFCRIGRLTMMSGDCAVSLDVPPFCMVNERNRVGGLNLIGLRRSGFSRDDISALKLAFREYLRRPLPRSKVVAGLEEIGRDSPPVMEMARFIAASKRGITPGIGRTPRAKGPEEAAEIDEPIEAAS